jgi:predicted ATPase
VVPQGSGRIEAAPAAAPGRPASHSAQTIRGPTPVKPSSITSDHYLFSMKMRNSTSARPDAYPFSLPALRNFRELLFHPKVTFFVGENGTGKSTLLEGIAAAWGFNPEGGSINFRFNTRASHSDLHKALTLVKTPKRPKDGYFLRAESFFNVATEIEELDREPGTPRIISSYGGRSLHEQSHGESFMALLLHRFGGHGLYVLDEPEAALSPARQLAMLARLHDLTELNSQFIIATHSPILMAYPNSIIYQIDESGINQVDYRSTEHYLVMRSFMNDPELSLDRLLR